MNVNFENEIYTFVLNILYGFSMQELDNVTKSQSFIDHLHA